MTTAAKTVTEYLGLLPADRLGLIEAVRKVVNDNLQPGFEEGIQYGHIGWFVPHSLYPGGYHCDPKQPVPFVGLASQKNHVALYLFCIYTAPNAEAAFRAEWLKTGKKLDMGKACVRFKKLEHVALGVIAETIRGMTLAEFIGSYESARKALK